MMCDHSDDDDDDDDDESFSLELVHDDLKFSHEKESEDEEKDDDNSMEAIVNTIQLKQLAIFSETLLLSGDNNNNNTNNQEWDKNMPLDLIIKLVLSKLGFQKSLEVFNKEWHQSMKTQLTNDNDTIAAARDILYQINSQTEAINHLQNQIVIAKDQAEKVDRQRDELRLHNHRLTEDNRQLICQIRYLKTLSQSYEPAIEESKKRYELISKNNTVIKLERDRLRIRVQELEEALTFLPMK